jgi:aspartate carbamoyltransferase catalytic subunit
VLRILGVGELRIVAPRGFMPGAGEFPGAQRFEDIDAGIRGADVVMMLRIQKERLADASALHDAAYFHQFGLTPERLKLAKPDAIVMHPGPMNRGIEIDSSVADGPQSVIRMQVTNGVAVRMAVLEAVTEGLRRLRQRA